MGRLYDLLQAHMDAQPYEVKPADIARKIGVSRQTVLNWKAPTKLIDKDHLIAIAAITGVPYQRVLDALLEDIGYLRPGVLDNAPEPPPKVTDEQGSRTPKRSKR